MLQSENDILHNPYHIEYVTYLFLAECGEKMGFEVTILLALVVYIDVIQDQVPVWSNVEKAPRIIWIFIISIIGNYD